MASKESLHGVLFRTYRRLRACGEEERMIRRSLSVESTEVNLLRARQFLSIHGNLARAYAVQKNVPWWNLPRKASCMIERKVLRLKLWRLRLVLRSRAAISDFLLFVLGAVSLFMMYQIYLVTRIGLTKADEKHKLIAIPILQTIESLEQAEMEKRSRRKAQMESDILRQRTSYEK